MLRDGMRAAWNALRYRNVSARTIVLGDVEIARSASVGPRCVLKADPESRIVLEPDVEIQRNCRLFARNGGEIRVREGATVKNDTRIMPREKGFDGSADIGEGTTIHRRNSLDNTGNIRIGPNVRTGEHSYFHTHSHQLDPIEEIWDRDPAVEDIVVGGGCWIGTMCQFMPGSGIPDHSVLAAGAIATESFDERGVFGGVPAERIRDL